MANKGDIYKVALPNGDEYNFKDKYVRENYRALNNNDFDTINVTELNSGDIINTGAARFLNPINGVCTDGTSGTTKYMRQDGTWAVPPNDNTDTKVTQTANSTDASYEILLSGTADNTTRTEGANKTLSATVNPGKAAFTFGIRYSGSTIGGYSFASGYNVTASGSYSHTEGIQTTATQEASHAEGNSTQATAACSHAEGTGTTAQGAASHAEGHSTSASTYAHAEGESTTAYGYASHSEGFYNSASGEHAHVEGTFNIANHKSQHVFGEYNIEDPSTAAATARGNYVEIVGNGTADNARANARTLDWSGNEVLSGGLSLGGRLTTQKPINQIITGTGTAAQDKGSGVSPRYFPVKWTFNTGMTATDGDIFTIKIPIAGHDWGVFVSVDNGTNYYPVGLLGTGRLTTHYPVNTYLTLIFEANGQVNDVIPVAGGDGRTNVTGGAWRVINYYDSNSNDTGYYLRRIYPNLKVGANKIFPYTLIMQNADGRWESIVTSSSTGTSKARNSHGFRLGQVLLMYANATYNENATVGTYNIWTMHSGLIDHRYSFNTANDSTNGTTGYQPVYIVGALGNDDLFYLDAKWWTQTLPSTADGKLYIYIGDAYDYYRMTFVDTQKIYRYVNGMIREYTQDAGTVNGLTVEKAVPSNAVFTDHTYNFGGTTFYSGNQNNSEHNANNIQYNGLYYYTSNGPSKSLGATSDDAAIFAQAYSTSWVSQIASDYRNGNLYTRGKNNGTWQRWRKVRYSDDQFEHSDTVYFDSTTSKIAVNKSTSAWDAQAYSTDGYVDNIMLSFKPNQTNMALMVGLDSNPSQDANYANIDYCWYVHNDTRLTMFESGTEIASISGHTTYVVGDELRVEYSGGYIRYYHNGVLCREVSRAISGKLYFDSSFHGKTSCIYDITFGIATRNATYAASAGSASSASSVAWSGVTSKPTTISGYGITDAKIANGVITLGSNTITPLTSASTLDATKLSGTIPSGCYTDTKNTAGSTDTSSKIFLIGATSQATNPQTYSDDQCYITSGTLTTANTVATIFIVNQTNGTSGGISLYNGTSQVDNYGIAFRTTANKEKHGYVQSDWATYFTMNDQDNRGWVFRRNKTGGNVASINTSGNMVLNGSLTVGGNQTNTSGARMVYNSTTQSLDFVFVA